MNTNVVAERTASSEQTGLRNLGQVIAAVSYRLSVERIGTAALAELRRISRDELPPAFWRLYLTDGIVPPHWREPYGKPNPRVDTAWASVIRAMVEMAPNPHSYKYAFGKALGESAYSEHRFVRLLRAEGKFLAREVRVAASWLAHKGSAPANWEQPASLLLGNFGIRGIYKQSTIHQIARDYFRAQSATP